MKAEDLTALYDGYLQEAMRAEQEQKPFDGLFGFGKKAADDPCHDRFAANLKTWLDAFRASKPESAELCSVLRTIYFDPKEHPEPGSIYWMLIAVQGLTTGLIPLLKPADAAALAEEYGAPYRRRERLPAQKQILEALIKRSNREE